MKKFTKNCIPGSKNYLRTICLFLCIFFTVEQSEAQITIVNKNTKNPTLMYKGKPMLAIGPMPEVAVFAVRPGSDYFSQKEWFNWMQEHKLGYGRVYPESGFPWVPYDADKRVFPFEVARWKNGNALVDITRFNQEYWDNFAYHIKQCADRGIVLQMQLYQRVFFAEKNEEGRWNGNYFNPDNNVNQWSVPSGTGGYGIFKAMTQKGKWQDMHEQWVEHILDAIGNNGNVMIDLINEGASYAINRAWIELTLDIIEQWEKKTGNDILVGMDFDHYQQRNDRDLGYILNNPRLELIIGEGAEGHVVPDLTAGNRSKKKEQIAVLYRQRYKKPFISINSPNLGLHEGIEDLHLYQWYALMVKVQGAGVYAKEYPLDFSAKPIRQYADRSETQIDFFRDIKDYASLDIAPQLIDKAPGKYRLALASAKEAVVYLHTDGYGKSVGDGQTLALENMAFPDGDVSVTLLHPKTGASTKVSGTVQKGKLSLKLPAFADDLAIYLLPEKPTAPVSEAKIQRFMLINTDTDKEIMELTEGTTIDLDKTGDINFTVDAIASEGKVAYVQLELQGPVSHTQKQGEPPYALFGDSGDGDFYGKSLKTGKYTLSAYVGEQKGAVYTVNFQVMRKVEEPDNTPKEQSFMLVNAATSQDIGKIRQGDMIDLSETGTASLAVRIHAAVQISLVEIKLEGPIQHRQTERLLPYTLFGDDKRGGYYSKIWKPGKYTLTSTPYTGSQEGTPYTVSFQVVDTKNAAAARFAIYPVPTTADLHVDHAYPAEEPVQLLLLDHMGNTLLSRPVSRQPEVLNLSAYGKGIYYVKMVSREGVETRRVTVE